MVNLIVIGKRVRLSRHDLGIKQEVLAHNVGISRSFLSLIENGHETDLKASLLAALARELQVSPAYLAGWGDDPLEGVADLPDILTSAAAMFPEFRPGLEGFSRLEIETQAEIVDAMLRIIAVLVRLAERESA